MTLIRRAAEELTEVVNCGPFRSATRLGAELGAQPSHVDVDGAGAAEEVVPPDLLQQLRPGNTRPAC